MMGCRYMADMNFSNAFNFASYRDGQVDPRTGQFSTAIRLATLRPEGAGAGRRDIYLMYTMNQLENDGYGVGWSINETEAIPLPEDWNGNGRRPATRLKLASGESFPIATWRDDNNYMRFRYKTLKTFFVKHGRERKLHVYHIDGSVETLMRVGPRNTYRTTDLVFENGERFVFGYTARHGRLNSIRNETTGTEFLYIEYHDDDGRIKRSRTLATGKRAAEMEFSFTSDSTGRLDFLEKISLPRQSGGSNKEIFPPGAYFYRYQRYAYDQFDIIRDGLTCITHPTGGRDEISYEVVKEADHINGHQRTLRAKTWKRVPGHGQPPIIRTYRYSDRRNFMGSPSGSEYEAGDNDTDFLDLAPDDYTYWCEESVVDSTDETLGKIVASTRTTFNKFHLMIEEKRTGWPFANEKERSSRSCVVKTSIEYNQVAPNKGHRPPRQMKDQPHNLRIPRLIRTEYQVFDSDVLQRQRSELTTIASDDFGNITSRTDPSGIETRYLYYPIGGEKLTDTAERVLCPPDPADLFQRHVKEETVIAAPVAGQRPGAVAETRKTRFTYVATPRPGEVVDSYFVQRATETSEHETVDVAYTYIETLGKSAWWRRGRLKEVTTTIRDLGNRQTGVSRTLFDYGYLADDHSLRETRTIVGKAPDGGQAAPTISAQRRVDLVTGLLLETGNYAGIAIHYDYDTVGRLTEEAIMRGGLRQAARKYRYDYARMTEGQAEGAPLTPARRRVRDAVSPGREYITTYDGLGRPVTSSETSAGKTRAIRTIAYDSCGGRRRRDTIHDWLDEPGTKSPRELQLTTKYDYDGWNQVCHTERPDGSLVATYRDHADNTLTAGVWGDGMTVTRYNAFGQVASVALASAFGRPQRTEERLSLDYDGFGRCISRRDAQNRHISIVHDSFDRVVSQTVNADQTDKRIVRIAYPPHTAADLPARVQIAREVLGEREFDDFGRVTTDRRAGIGTTRYVYKHAPGSGGGYDGLKPSAREAPGGTELNFSYDPVLDMVTGIAGPRNQSLTYSYDAATGQMKRASSAAADNDFEYDEYLHLKQSRTTIRPPDGWRPPAGARTVVTLTSRSPAGRLYRTARAGEKAPVDVERKYYDDKGRLAKIEIPWEGKDAARIEYKYDGQGRVTNTTASLNGTSLETAQTFDDFGREASRSFHLAGRKLRTIRLSYDAAGKLARRETKIYDTDRDGGGTGRAAVDAARTIIVETFAYDRFARLVTYNCTNQRPAQDARTADGGGGGGGFPRDSQGRQILSQSFTYDTLDNIVTVETGFVGGNSEKLERRYGGNAPGQLKEIKNKTTNQTISLEYHPDGHLKEDGYGQDFTFDAFGRLTRSSRGGFYRYDALGRLVWQTLTLDYENGRLAEERKDDRRLRYLRDDELVFGRSLLPADEEGAQLLYALGPTGSVVGTAGKDTPFADRLYTPYGEFKKSEGEETGLPLNREQIAFNGERFDAAAGLYLLGNGRRAYCPRLMIFLSPDPLSPFDGAGYAPYGYCRGDPTNTVDPSGLFPLPPLNLSPGESMALGGLDVALSGLAYFLAVAAVISTGGSALAVFAAFGAAIGLGSAVFGLGSAVMGALDDAENSSALNKISVGLGLTSLALSAPTAAAGGIAAARALRNVSWSARAWHGGKTAFQGFIGYDDIPWKAAIGMGAFGVGNLNLYQGIATWDGGGGTIQDGPLRSGPWGPALAPRHPVGPRFRDAIVRLMIEEEEFSREAARIRGCFGTELYDEAAV